MAVMFEHPRPPWSRRVGLRPLRLALVLLGGCESGVPSSPPDLAVADASVDLRAPPDLVPPKTGLLGLNDVTVLIPLADPGTPALLMASDKGSDGNELVSRATYDRLNNVPKRGPVVFLDDLYPLLQVVAVRFDLCDRTVPGPCADEDGRMRVIVQAQYDPKAIGNIDLGLHAFFTIPKADFPALVTELRALSALQGLPDAAPLQPSPALLKAPSGEYAMRLKALILKYGVQANLTRVTFVGARDGVRSASWTLRGIEKGAMGFADIQIPGIGSTVQDTTLGGATTASFDVMPVADAPKGFVLATDEASFAVATPQDRAAALAALNAIDNPTLSTPNNVSCVTCHISGRIVGAREQVARVDSRTLPNRFTSGTFDLTVPLLLKSSLRSLGWAHRAPLISQRVANDSAQVASEMNARFPP